MPLLTEDVVYQNGKTEITIVVGQATALMGMKRAVFNGWAEQWIKDRQAAILETEAGGDEPDDGDVVGIASLKAADFFAASLAVRLLYPSLMAAAISAEGLVPSLEAMTIDAFLELPDGLVAAWEDKVSELNPHWFPARDGGGGKADDGAAEAEEKKG